MAVSFILLSGYLFHVHYVPVCMQVLLTLLLYFVHMYWVISLVNNCVQAHSLPQPVTAALL